MTKAKWSSLAIMRLLNCHYDPLRPRKKTIKLEISSRQNGDTGGIKAAKHAMSSGLEMKLDELRKELSSTHEGILPHSILSTQQISMLSTEKPTSIEQLEKLIGKLKTEKYGSRILECIRQFVEAEGNSKSKAEGCESRSCKRLKTKKAVVLVESSSGDEG
ncbi:hypothetical protein ACLOJK_034098 [Asimina triloba]